MSSRNLEPGQFQLGDLIMGRHTLYAVEEFGIGNYDVNVQDYQAQSSNETGFGQDTLRPAPIQLTINFRPNAQLANVASLLANPKMLDFSMDPTLGDLQREWRAEETLAEWGATKPLYFCGTDGITRMIYGRPGKFMYKLHRIVGSQYYQCAAEFRRLDTHAHSETEWYRVFDPDVPQTITLERGNAPSWVRFLITGPANHPIINFGSHQIELDYNVLTGQVVEICSYPWQRRAVTNDGLSVAAFLISEKPYLDRVRFQDHVPKLISWTATGTNANSKMTLLWRDAYQVIQ